MPRIADCASAAIAGLVLVSICAIPAMAQQGIAVQVNDPNAQGGVACVVALGGTGTGCNPGRLNFSQTASAPFGYNWTLQGGDRFSFGGLIKVTDNSSGNTTTSFKFSVVYTGNALGAAVSSQNQSVSFVITSSFQVPSTSIGANYGTGGYFSSNMLLGASSHTR